VLQCEFGSSLFGRSKRQQSEAKMGRLPSGVPKLAGFLAHTGYEDNRGRSRNTDFRAFSCSLRTADPVATSGAAYERLRQFHPPSRPEQALHKEITFGGPVNDFAPGHHGYHPAPGEPPGATGDPPLGRCWGPASDCRDRDRRIKLAVLEDTPALGRAQAASFLLPAKGSGRTR